jgi:hypothetical protein
VVRLGGIGSMKEVAMTNQARGDAAAGEARVGREESQIINRNRKVQGVPNW